MEPSTDPATPQKSSAVLGLLGMLVCAFGGCVLVASGGGWPCFVAFFGGGFCASLLVPWRKGSRTGLLRALLFGGAGIAVGFVVAGVISSSPAIREPLDWPPVRDILTLLNNGRNPLDP